MFKAARALSASRESGDTTTKRAKIAKVGGTAGTDLKGRLGSSTMRDHIVQANIMVEGVRPEFSREIGTTKKSAKSIFNGAVGTLDRTVLMRRIAACRLKAIASILKETTDISRLAQFTTKIHTNVFIRDIFATAMGSKPAINKIDRSGLGGESTTIKLATVMISNGAIAGLAIESSQTLITIRIAGLLDDKAHVN
jgi:hypothetical protein